MANATKKAASPAYDDDRQYIVTLTEPIDLGHGMLLRPGESVTVSGAVLNANADKVDDAQPAE